MATYPLKMNISVITPSVRKEGLQIIKDCLRRQDFNDYEWIVVSPFEYDGADVWLKDPPKRKGDFWNLCKAWNKAYANARGELIVNIQDMISFPPDTLSRFWSHYQINPKALVTAVGDHFDSELKNVVWSDPRKLFPGDFIKTESPDMEMTMCSIPTQAILDCGGIDEDYDKGPGVQEKEMCFRLSVLGYKMYIDKFIEYKAIHHPRLTDNWDDMYWKVTAPMYEKHVKAMMKAERPLSVNNIEKYRAK